MTEYPAGRGSRTRDLAPRLRLAALTAVIIGVLLLAAAAFVLSYSGIHHIALQAGVSSRLARLYPVIFDAMLVIASAAVLALRGAGVPTRVYVWLCLIVLLGAVAAGDAVYATGVALPRQPARATVAITPWALLLLAFGLLLAMLRHLRRARASAREKAQARVIRGHVSLLAPRPGEPPALPATEQPARTQTNGTAATQAQAAAVAAGGTAAAGDAGSPPPQYQGAGEYAGPGRYSRAGAGTGEEGQPGAGHPGMEHLATEEYLGTEDYGGSAEYPETDEYHEAAAAQAGPRAGLGEWAGQERYGGGSADAGAQPGGAQPGSGESAGAAPEGEERDGGQQDAPPGGEADGRAGEEDSPGPAMPASAPVPHFERMHSTPTRPQD